MAQTTIVDGLMVKGQHIGADYRNQQLLVNTATSTPARAFALSEWTTGSAALTAAFEAADAATALNTATQLAAIGNRLDNLDREVLLQTSVKLRFPGTLAELNATDGWLQNIAINPVSNEAPTTNAGMLAGAVLLESPNAGEDGIYFRRLDGQFVRHSSFDTVEELSVGTEVYVAEGTYAQRVYQVVDNLFGSGVSSLIDRTPSALITDPNSFLEIAAGQLNAGLKADYFTVTVNSVTGKRELTLSAAFLSRISDMENEIAALQSDVEANTTSIAGNTSAIAQLNTTVSTQGTTLTNLGNTVAQQGLTLNTLSTTVSAQGTTLTNLGNTVAQQGTALTNLVSNFQNLEDVVASNSGAIAQLETSVTALDGTVTQQGVEISSNTADILALQAAVAGVVSLTAIKAMIAAMKKVLILTNGVYNAGAGTTTFVVSTGWTSASFWVNGIREAGAPYESGEDPKMEIIADPASAGQFAVRLTFSAQIADNTLSVGVELYDPAGLPVASPGGGSPNNLLGLYPGAAHFGMTRQNASYNGPHMRVRRSTDNAELTINFNGDALNTAALLAFGGVGDVFVHTIYDDSGNGRNLEQTDPSKQPKIVSNGVVCTNNGKPVMRFSRANQTHLSRSGNVTVGSTLAIVSCTDSIFPDENGLLSDLTGVVAWSGAGAQAAFNSYHTTGHYVNNQATLNFLPAPNLKMIFSEQTAGNTVLNGIVVGNDRNAAETRSWEGDVAHIFMFNNNESANRLDIQTSLNADYNCY
jgi:uncharacterized coiled-coil protein SlyX